MADSILTPDAFLNRLLSGEEMDFLREALTSVAREIVELEITKNTGAGRGERMSLRVSCHRNGYRDRRWYTPGRRGLVAHPQGPG